MKLLLYGNCQLSVIGDWLSGFKSLEILKPQHYGVPTVHPWEDKLFFPGTVSQTPGSIYKALDDCDLFIFHHCKKDILLKPNIYMTFRMPRSCALPLFILTLTIIQDTEKSKCSPQQKKT